MIPDFNGHHFEKRWLPASISTAIAIAAFDVR